LPALLLVVLAGVARADPGPSSEQVAGQPQPKLKPVPATPKPPVEPRPTEPTAGIRPAPLKSDREELALPGSVADVRVGGGGRYLIFSLPSRRQLAIFDANEARIVKYLPLAEDDARFAAGIDKLIVALPGANILQRYDLTTFEREATVQSPVAGTLQMVQMGSASRGPLYLFAGGGGPGRGSGLTLIDPYTFKPLPDVKTPGLGYGVAGSFVSLSGNGRVLTEYHPNISPQGHVVHHFTGKEFKSNGLAAGANGMDGRMTAGAEGRFLYTARGVFTSEGQPVGKLGSYSDGTRYCLPAAEGEIFHLRIDVPGFPHGDDNQAGKLYLHLLKEDRPLAALDGVDVPKRLNTWGRVPFSTDRYLHLIPSAKLLVALAPAHDRLVLHRVDVDALLAKADHDYLLVFSRPPETAVRGQTYTYTPVVKAKKGGVKIKVDAGPDGMKAAADGTITWAVPANYEEKEVFIITTVSDATGQEIFHTFRLVVKDKADSASAPLPPRP
jgi:hypothetical protein